jgi:glycine betaine/proline transport system ATP-binding protein
MREPKPDDSLDGPEFPPETVIRAATHAAVSTDRPIKVVADGKLLGVVDRRQIISAIAGGDEEAELDVERLPSPDPESRDGVGP